MIETLEAAQYGLQWFLKEYPEDGAGADDEMMEQIEQALAILNQA